MTFHIIANMVATSHMWVLNTWNGARATEELFFFYFL